MKSSKKMVGLLFRANVEKPSPVHLNERDAMMADNLLWLAKTAHPKSKIIVWSTSYHNARNYQMVDAESELMPMGHRAWQDLGAEMYSLAFTAFEGQTGMVHQDAKELAEAPRDSLEGLWGASTHRRAFLDMRHVADGGDWLKAPFAARMLSEQTAMADWAKMFDGVVFLRAMQPSRSID
jgi:erythromycin esterase